MQDSKVARELEIGKQHACMLSALMMAVWKADHNFEQQVPEFLDMAETAYNALPSTPEGKYRKEVVGLKLQLDKMRERFRK